MDNFSKIKENSYGIKKRLEFVCGAIDNYCQRKNINSTIFCMDVGSGTGDALLIPLCKKYQNFQFISIEPDDSSTKILNEFQKKLNIENLCVYKSLKDYFARYKDKKVDILIISEVLEHVENPCIFLKSYINFLRDGGILILTIPNGFGPFEIDQLLFKIGKLLKLNIVISPILTFARMIRKKIRSNNISSSFVIKGSAAVSPHIQFFSFRKILFMMRNLGFKLLNYQGRTFICGPIASYILDKIVFTQKLNNILGSFLPPFMVSGWMFVFLKESNILEIDCESLNQDLYSNIVSKVYRKIKIFLNKKFLL